MYISVKRQIEDLETALHRCFRKSRLVPYFLDWQI